MLQLNVRAKIAGVAAIATVITFSDDETSKLNDLSPSGKWIVDKSVC